MMAKSATKHLPLLAGLLLSTILLAACTSLANDSQSPEKIAYLNWDDDGIAQIFLSNSQNETTQQLTDSESSVVDYAISPDQTHIAFITRSATDGDLLWLMDWNGRKSSTPQQILTCPEATCTPLVWHPDGQRLIYERRARDASNRPILWWVDVQTSETITVLTDPTEMSADAAVSPDGAWFSYVSAPTESMQFVNFATGDRFAIPSTVGMPAVWHPDSQQAIIRDLDLTVYHGDEGEEHDQHDHDFAEAVHLFSTSITSQQRQVLDDIGNVDDSNAAYSPDGQMLAFGRKVARTNTGRQLWLMQADGSDPQALTEELMMQHGPATWSENGRILLFQQADLSQPSPQPSIWQYDLKTSQMKQLVPSGWFPNWLR